MPQQTPLDVKLSVERMIEIVGRECDVVESADVLKDIFSRPEDPKSNLFSEERMGLLPGFPGSYEYAVKVC